MIIPGNAFPRSVPIAKSNLNQGEDSMKRRGFIKIMAAGSGVILVSSILSDCDTQHLTALDGWRGPDPADHDIRMIVLSYALLAPNPHNKQPWIIDLTGPRQFDLYV